MRSPFFLIFMGAFVFPTVAAWLLVWLNYEPLNEVLRGHGHALFGGLMIFGFAVAGFLANRLND